MSRVTLALGSFVFGACCMYFLGSHTSTVTQSLFAQTKAAPQSPPAAEKPQPFVAGTAILLDGVEPQVPPLHMSPVNGMTVIGKVMTQALDGINCRGCVVDAMEVTYAGGALNCIDCKIKGDRVTLKGAALNTFIILQGLTNFLNVPERPRPNSPHVSIAASKRDTKLTLVSATQ